MPRFRVEVLETRRLYLEIEAETEEDARQQAQESDDQGSSDTHESRVVDDAYEISG